MSDNRFKNIVFFGLSLLLIVMPLSMGGVWLWSLALMQWVVGLLVFLWFWRMNNHSGWHFRSTALDIPIVLFFILAVITSVFSIYPYASWIEVSRILTYIGVYYLVVNHFDSRRRLYFCVLIIAVAAGLSLFGMGQYFLGLNNSWWSNVRSLSATFVNHSHFAGYLEMTMALTAGLLLGLNRDEVRSRFELNKWRMLLLSALGMMVLAFVWSQSRGGWVAFTLASCIFVFVLVFKEKTLSKGALVFFLTGLIIFIGYLGFGEDRVARRLHTIETDYQSRFFKARLNVWKHTLPMIQDHPKLGTGLGTFVWAFPKYRPESFKARFHYAHNDYLHMVTETGVVVIPILIWGIWALLKRGFGRYTKDFQLKRMIRLGCAFGVLSLMIHGLVDFNFQIPSNMLIFVCLSAIIMRS